MFIWKLVSSNQTTFITGRQILDRVLVANEIIDLTKRNMRNYLVCKMDFAQANDCVNWNYARFMLRRMGFRVRWMLWMEASVFTSSMLILDNGSPTKEFKVSRGLRQGDPLSPFLFTIVDEGLVGMVRRPIHGGLNISFQVSNEVEYSLLQFADDTTLIGDGSSSNSWALKDLFRGFEMVFGLRINLSKSKLYDIGISPFDLEVSSQFLGCKIEPFLYKFVGIIIGGNQRKVNGKVALAGFLQNHPLKFWIFRYAHPLDIKENFIHGSLETWMALLQNLNQRDELLHPISQITHDYQIT